MIKFKNTNNKPPIKFIVLHHTAVFNNGKPQIYGVNRYHRDKNWGSASSPWYQPSPSELGWYVGYNFFCDVTGVTTQTRIIGEETIAQKGHNCDTIQHCDAISYSMASDNRYQKPNAKQKESFINFITEVRKYYPQITVVGHCTLDSRRTCPELSPEYINQFNKKLDPVDEDKSEKIKKLQQQIDVARAMIAELMRRFKLFAR